MLSKCYFLYDWICHFCRYGLECVNYTTSDRPTLTTTNSMPNDYMPNVTTECPLNDCNFTPASSTNEIRITTLRVVILCILCWLIWLMQWIGNLYVHAKLSSGLIDRDSIWWPRWTGPNVTQCDNTRLFTVTAFAFCRLYYCHPN